MKRFFLIILLLAFTTSTAFTQTTISGGIVNGRWTKANSPYNLTGSIQIVNGDSLIIEPGVTISFQGTYKLLVLGKLIAIGKPNDNIIFTAADTNSGWRGIRFDNTPPSNDTSRIKYCKIQYGRATGSLTPEQNGGGIYFYNFSKAVVSYSSIVNCNADYSGGGICIGSSSPVITNNYISNNISKSSGYGGGIYITGNPLIQNNIITNNKADEGPGIYIGNSSPLIQNNTITNNIGRGGINIQYGSPKIINNIISFNSETGIKINSGSNSNPYIGYNIISNNTGYIGGGISCNGKTIITNNFICNNTAIYSGGGIDCSSHDEKTIISNNLISNNIVSQTIGQSGGGGIRITSSYKAVQLFNNLITNNRAGYGGGLLSFNSSPTFTNNTIANNNASISGGAFYCSVGSPIFINCIFWGNSAITSGSQTFIYDEASDPDFNYCDVEGGSNAFELNGNFYTGSYTNNINKNPLFVNPSAGSGSSFNGTTADWGLKNNSPCRDAGNLSGSYPSTDIAGNKRISNRIIDMGAYEFPVILTDAGLELISPNNSSNCGKIKLPITVQLSNLGDDTIKGVNIVLKINGVVKKSISWTGFLLPLRDSSFTIDSFLFDTSNAYDVSVFSSKPNSVADTFNTNDTVKALIKVYPIPDASFSHTVINDTVAFTRHNTSSASSTWQFGDGSSSTQNNPSHIYTHTKTYTVTHTITSVNGCVATYQESFNVMVAGFKSFSKSAKLSVYPNPVNSTISVQYVLAKPSAVNIAIYDISGKNIYASDLGLISSGNHSSQFDASGFSAGIYLLKIDAGDVSMYSRIIKN